MHSRRNFIKTGSLGSCALLAGIGTQASGCASASLLKINSVNNLLIVKKSHFLDKRFLQIRTPELEFDILLHQKSENEYTAIFLQCSHQNQPLTASGKSIFCPSHGSTFDFYGKAMKAPATKSLRIFPIKTTDQEIIISIQ